MMLRRLSLLTALVALFYLATIQLGPVGWYLHDVMTPPVANDGYSGYTMYERCHIDAAGVMHSYYTHRKDC